MNARDRERLVAELWRFVDAVENLKRDEDLVLRVSRDRNGHIRKPQILKTAVLTESEAEA